MTAEKITDGRPVQARFAPSEFQAIEDFRRAQPRIPRLSDTFRLLVLRGLAASTRDQQRDIAKPEARR
jgi:hypothetical protein